MRAKNISLAEKKFILQLLSKRQRLDKRNLLDQRPIGIQTSNKIPGTCLVSLGNTKVLIQTNYKIEEPREVRPLEGRHRIRVEPSTAAIYENSSKNRESKNKDYDDIEELLDQAFVKSKCLDLESLCIRAASACFTIESNLAVLSDDGSLPDCCSIAIAIGLKHFKLPATIINGDKVSIDNSRKSKLSIYHLPFLLTFASFSNDIEETINNYMRKVKSNLTNLNDQLGEIVLDPTHLESSLANGSLILAINKHRELCSMKSQGGICLALGDISRASSVAEKQVKIISKIVEDSLSTSGVDKFDFSFKSNIQKVKIQETSGGYDMFSIGSGYRIEAPENQTQNNENQIPEFNDSNLNQNIDGGLINNANLQNMPDLEADWGISDLISSMKNKSSVEDTQEPEQAEES